MKGVAIFLFLMVMFGISLLLLQRFYYTIIISIYHLVIKIISPFHKKARLWVQGRKDLFNNLQAAFSNPAKKTIWFHCASLGEFEQARPVIEKIKSIDPGIRILLTFYSPSGYEVRKNYPVADHVTYLPADTRSNAKKFLSIAKPDIAVFVKYEFWYHHINELNKNNIPLYLVSGVFRKNQIFFKWYSRLFKQLLKKYNKLFVQNEESILLLKKINVENAEIIYDTRFDRVKDVADSSQTFPALETFLAGHNSIIGGSTWPADEKLLAKAFYKTLVYQNFKLIIVPHNIDPKSLSKTKKVFKKYSLVWSELDKATPADLQGKRVLIIDNIGILSSLYRYGDLSYVGGGLGKGIHNILEAAVYGKPIFIGPKYKKFNEAVELVNKNAAFVIRDPDELINRINLMNQFQFIFSGAGKESQLYVMNHLGGTEKIVKVLMDKVAQL